MQSLKRAWKDIQRGENIDFYVTVFIAISLAVLNILGITPQALIGPLTLAVLALLAMAMLGNRHKIEEILTSRKKIFVTEFPRDKMEADFRRAEEILLIGTHLNREIKTYYPLFKEKLSKGDHIKVLLLDPDGMACKMSEMRYPVSTRIKLEKEKIQSSLDMLDSLQKIKHGRLEVRVIDYLFGYEAFIVNPKSSNGVVYLVQYTFRELESLYKPKLIYSPKDEEWYNLICSEAQVLWENGEDWSPRRTTDE